MTAARRLIEPDKVTQAAFREYWQLWCNNQSVSDNMESWRDIIGEANRIAEKAAAAADPDFIIDFGIAVISSLERLNNKSDRV